MYFSLFIARYLEIVKPAIASIISYISFLWMGFLILFVTFSVILLIFGIILKLSLYINILISTLLTICLMVYGYINAQTIHIKEINIYSEKIRFSNRIVFFSDLHAGLINKRNYVEKVVNMINSAKAQIILAGGDIIDSQMDGIDKNIEPLSKLNAKYKFAIIGNHEVYRGVNFSIEHLNKVGFVVLKNSCVNLDGVSIVGIDDEAASRLNKTDFNQILYSCSHKNFIILLKHRPLISDSLYGGLMLSGHTHAGQMFPFTLITKLFYRGKDYGLFNMGKRQLLVSSGCGTWGPPLRIFTHSEIVVINLLPKNNM